MTVLKAYVLRNKKSGRWFKRRCRTRGKSYGKVTTTADHNLALGLAGLEYAQRVRALLPGDWELILSE